MQKIVIPGELPDFNTIIKKSKSHWSKYAAFKHKYTFDVALIIRSQKLKPVKKYPIKIKFCFYCKGQRKDPDGISSGARKVILDSLKVAQIIIDDGFKYIAGFTDEFYLDKNNPRIEVFIEE